MKKKVVFLILILSLALIVCGIFAFKKGRDYVTGRVIRELAETEEVKKYEEQIKKNAEVQGENTESTEGKETVNNNQETPEKLEEPTKKAGSIWDEPLVQSVYARFSASEISTVTGMMADGFTKEEKKYIKSLVFSRVSSAEISQLKEIYYKYNN